VENFFDGDNKKISKIVRDIEFIEVLHLYYSELQQGSKNPVEGALNQIRSRDGVTHFTTETFNQYYKELNGKNLSRDFKIIYEDFTPSAYVTKPLGTNLIVDVQDDLRNEKANQ
jgi:hypothetical protein